MELVVGQPLARRLDAEADEMQAGHARPDATHRLESIRHTLPLVLVVQHQHARPRRRHRHLDTMKERAIDRSHQHVAGGAERLAHDVGQPRGDDDLPKRQPVGRVDHLRRAVIEALVVLDQIELHTAARGCGGHHRRRLPRGGEDGVRLGQRVRIPARDPSNARPEARDPGGSGASNVAPGGPRAAARGHDHGDLVAAGGQPVGIGEDRAHAAGDAQVRTEDGESQLRSPSTPSPCSGRRPDRGRR